MKKLLALGDLDPHGYERQNANRWTRLVDWLVILAFGAFLGWLFGSAI